MTSAPTPPASATPAAAGRAPSPELAIRLRAVEKTFGKGESAVRALRGVDLDVPAGALTMLVGPSGCGKTTLISILAGLLARDAGELAVCGQDLGAARRSSSRAASSSASPSRARSSTSRASSCATSRRAPSTPSSAAA